MKFPEVKMKTAVITGCSSGIGLAAADMMKAHGWRVIATARKPADLEMLAGRGLETLELDVADESSVICAARQIKQTLREGVGVLVNNAGFGQVGAIEDLTRASMLHQFQVNVFGLQHLTNLLLPDMRAQGFGRVINISSVLGRLTLPYLGIYSASKYAVESISDALRIELHGSGIAVSIIEPGPIVTAFGENAARHAERTINPATTAHSRFYKRELERRANQAKTPEPFALPPSAVARKIIHAAESPRPRRRYQVTFPAYAGVIMSRLAPAALIDWIMAKRSHR